MRTSMLLAACVAAAALLAAPVVSQQTAGQPDLEKRFDTFISSPEMDGWMKRMAAEPNHVGAAHNKANADYTLQRFKDWGWDAKIETFDVLYPTPIKVSLDLVTPKRFASSTMHVSASLPIFTTFSKSAISSKTGCSPTKKRARSTPPPRYIF